MHSNDYELLSTPCYATSMNNAREGFSPAEVADMFPTSKAVVKRLIKEREKFIEEIREERAELIAKMCEGLTSFEIHDGHNFESPIWKGDVFEHITDLYMAEKYRNKIFDAQANLVELKRILHAFEPKGAVVEGETTRITDADILRARAHPVSDLVKVNKMGFAQCPFHEEKTASLKVYKDNHTYCFGCHTRADAIDLYQKLHGVEFVEAVKALL